MYGRLAKKRGQDLLEFPAALNEELVEEKMVEEFHLFRELRNWLDEHKRLLKEEGIYYSLDDSRMLWEAPSLWLNLENSIRMSQITVWATGDVQCQYGDIPTGAVFDRYQNLGCANELRVALESLVRWQLGGEIS